MLNKQRQWKVYLLNKIAGEEKYSKTIECSLNDLMVAQSPNCWLNPMAGTITYIVTEKEYFNEVQNN